MAETNSSKRSKWMTLFTTCPSLTGPELSTARTARKSSIISISFLRKFTLDLRSYARSMPEGGMMYQDLKLTI